VGRSLGHVCASTVLVPPDPLSPIHLASSAMKTQKNIQEWPDDPEPVDEWDIQVEFSSDQLCCPSIGPGTKTYV
jgi:hypothetical protein